MIDLQKSKIEAEALAKRLRSSAKNNSTVKHLRRSSRL